MTKNTKNNVADEAKICCFDCGEELTSENSIEGGLPYCVRCQRKQYEELRQQNGTSLALYLATSRFNLPLYPLLLPDDFEEEPDKWERYLEILSESGKLFKADGRLATFADGETCLLKIFGREFSQKDFAKYVLTERAKVARLEGTEEQRRMWGVRNLWENVPMTTEIYNELDDMYEARLENYKGVSLSDATQATLRRVCKWTLAQDYLQSKGEVASIDKLQKSIDSAMAAEQLRKKDEKPVEALRPDALVQALENAGLMQNGDLLPYDELLNVLRDNFVKSKKYDYSLDVADQLILDVINSMRANADLVQVAELEEQFAPVDEYGEFEPTETEQEIKNKQYAGLTKVSIAKGGGNKAGD